MAEIQGHREDEYDDLYRLTKLRSVIDALSRVTSTSYEYDALGRQTKVTQPDPDGAGSQTAPETTYSYDAMGNVLAVTDALGNETEYEYEYDNLYRLIKLTEADPDGAGSQARLAWIRGVQMIPRRVDRPSGSRLAKGSP